MFQAVSLELGEHQMKIPILMECILSRETVSNALFFFAVLGFELRALHLLSHCCLSHIPVLFALVIFQMSSVLPEV
jgi:hypothetical protein